MNGIILIDKDKGLTSYDVCHKLKRHFKTKKVGHSGTLDPNATGLLLVAINNATKSLNFLPTDKEYVAEVKLGYMTDSLDPDGTIIKEEDINAFTEKELEMACKSFLGNIKQTPPIYSAIKVNGKKLYEYAREGKEVEIKERDAIIHEIELLEMKSDGFKYRVKVSSGTYIRTLSLDIAKKINNIATTVELRRTMIGDISVDDASTIENPNVINISKLTNLPKIIIEDTTPILHGKKINIDTKHDKVFLVDKGDNALAVYQKDGDIYRSIRGLF